MERIVLFISLVAVSAGVLFLGVLFFKTMAKKKKFRALSIGGAADRVAHEEDQLNRETRWYGFLYQENGDMEQKLERAGIYNNRWAGFYLPVKYTTAFVGVVALYSSTLGITSMKQLAIIALWLIAVIVVPDLYLEHRRKVLQDKISNQLPYLLDLMAMCVQTGMTVEASIQYLSSELSALDKDLGHTMNIVNERSRLVGLDQALDELYQRFPATEVRSFVMTLKQSLRYGSAIYSVLNNLASDIREVRVLALEEKIGKLSAKMSVPLILFILIPIVILIAAPGIMRLMYGQI
ncbi:MULTISPECIES: type II secretion system F family protein [Vibrio]|uniref:type II secretion system F family protein n=1 Tax=Vibrio TaxID=662 RepID=UPI0001B953D8|nr:MULTISPECIES: type II secretion system F family protein [Vibrio]EEX34233.1 type II/IV secretion system protein TadC associated with Flp pilus assembly [Vibrio coralliilyticus ATCC BAA-450]MDE3898640.1 type II secretion system F family protein [Vibrio sp. CC007]